jgi:threonine/homoserine/homoserine lactone efflux protein
MTGSLIFKGMLIGFSIAAPVGPIGILCIRRSLAQGRRIGLATGLGAATADAAYGCVAGFGLTAISSFLIGQKMWLSLLGGLFLSYLGIRTFTTEPAEQPTEAVDSGLLGAYLSTLLLTITNPMTILCFAAVFAGLGLGSGARRDYLSASELVAGVFAGSALWWLLLSSGVGLLKGQISLAWMRLINRASGTIILTFGLYSLWTALR